MLNLAKLSDLNMNNNQQLIETFYNGFQQLNANKMNACYSADIVFFDPIFGLLHGEEVNSMWEMLCKTAANFSLLYFLFYFEIKNSSQIKPPVIRTLAYSNYEH